MSDSQDKNNNDETKDAPRDRARRRLIKQGLYVAPAILTMTAFLSKARAEDAKFSVNPTVNPQAAAQANVPVGGGKGKG